MYLFENFFFLKVMQSMALSALVGIISREFLHMNGNRTEPISVSSAALYRSHSQMQFQDKIERLSDDFRPKTTPQTGSFEEEVAFPNELNKELNDFVMVPTIESPSQIVVTPPLAFSGQNSVEGNDVNSHNSSGIFLLKIF
jgi:hypothetical protein